MTVSVAWTRTLADREELFFVADSRLSGGARTFDYCPKILTLPRSDCAISFAGATDDAYPMMLQLALAIDAHAPLKRRSLDIRALKTHALKIFDSMAGSIHSEVGGDESAHFIFGGYSWSKKCFELWTIQFDASTRTFRANPAKSLLYSRDRGRAYVGYGTSEPPTTLRMGKIAFAGDQGPTARERVIELVAQRRGEGGALNALDMEPFEVVRDMLRSPERHHTIGGAPQVVKVHQYMHTEDVGVYWPQKKSGHAFLRGRPRLAYENLDQRVIDPDTLEFENPHFAKEYDADAES